MVSKGISGTGQASRRGEMEPNHEAVASILSRAALCLRLSDGSKKTDYQYGYLVAPHLVVTVWHPLFAEFLARQLAPPRVSRPVISIFSGGFPSRDSDLSEDARVSDVVAANSQADCVLLRLDRPLSYKHCLTMGLFVQPSKLWEQVQCYLRHKDDSSPLGSLCSAALGLFANVQPTIGQPVHELIVSTAIHPKERLFYQGAPVISEASGQCLGHISRVAAPGMNQFWICPATAIAQLNPRLIRAQDASKVHPTPTDILYRLKMHPPARVRILTCEERDESEIGRALELTGLLSQEQPLLEVKVEVIPRYRPGMRPKSDADAHIVVVLLDEELCKYYQLIEPWKSSSSRGRHQQTLLGCIVADKLDASAESFLRWSTLHLSVERPLRWIFDRSRRVAAWLEIFYHLQLLISRATTFQEAAL